MVDSTEMIKEVAAVSSLTPLLISLCVFFAIAGVVVPMLKRIHCSPVIGFLLCGALIGPYGLGRMAEEVKLLSPLVFDDIHAVRELGELGVIALMFMIGLELSFRRLIDLRRYVLGLGSLQILITGTVIGLIALQFGNSMESSLLIGASLALSSTAIVVQLLNDRHLMNREVGRVSFSVLLMQDMAVVPILVLLAAFSKNSDASLLLEVGKALAMAFLAVAGIFFLGKTLLRPALKMLRLSSHPEWLTAIVLFLVIGTAAVTQSAGLSAALGAFLAGLLIAETEYRHEVEVIFEPVKELLLGVFFLSIGMMIDVREVFNSPYWLFGSVIGIFVIKAALMFPLCLSFGIAKARALEVSIILAQGGEFAFLILSMALAADLIPVQDVQFFLLLTAISMLCSPIFSMLAPLAGRKLYEAKQREYVRSSQDKDTTPPGLHIIIAGFGRIGKVLGTILEKEMIPYVAIDQDGERVTRLRAKGYRVIYGDARKIQLWRRLKPETAAAVVITIDNHEAAVGILKAVRAEWPMLPIIIRAKDTAAMVNLYDLGANSVVPETLESSLQLASRLLTQLGLEEQEISDLIYRKRKQLELEHADAINQS